MTANGDRQAPTPEEDLDALLRAADPLVTGTGRGRARHLPADDIREAVMNGAGNTVQKGQGRGARQRWGASSRPRLTAALAAAAAVVVVAGATTLAIGLPGAGDQPVEVGAAPTLTSDPSQAPSAPAPVPAPPTQSSLAPQPTGDNYLLGEEWDVVRVDHYADASGPAGEAELVRADGAAVQLTWRPAATHESYLEDRRNSSAEEREVAVDGAVADLMRYDTPAGMELDLTALWLLGNRSYELRGTADSMEQFAETLAELARVSDAAWTAALPDDAVLPEEQNDVVASMLEDVPLPPGTAADDVVVPGGARDEYQVGAAVIGSVACGWISVWIEAVDSGDDATAQQAVDAMASSRQWATLLSMDQEGDYPEAIWQYADAIAGTTPVPGGTNDLTVEDTYRTALGC